MFIINVYINVFIRYVLHCIHIRIIRMKKIMGQGKYYLITSMVVNVNIEFLLLLPQDIFIFQAWSTHGALIFIHQIFEFFVLSTYI